VINLTGFLDHKDEKMQDQFFWLDGADLNLQYDSLAAISKHSNSNFNLMQN